MEMKGDTEKHRSIQDGPDWDTFKMENDPELIKSTGAN